MAIKPSNEETSQCLLGVDSDTQEWYGRAPPATVNLLVAASVLEGEEVRGRVFLYYFDA
jgi:hypothetical protein